MPRGSTEERPPLPFQIEPCLGLSDISAAGQALPIRCEEEPRRHLAREVLAEGLDDRVDALPALPHDEHAHVVHAEAFLVDVGTEGRAVGDELPQDERLLKPRAHDRHGAAVDLEEEELAVLGRRKARVLDREDGVGLEVKRSTRAAVLDVDRPAGWPRVALRCCRCPTEDLVVRHQPERFGLHARLLHRDHEVGDEKRVLELGELAVGLDRQPQALTLHDELGALGCQHVDHVRAAFMVDELAGLCARPGEIALVEEMVEPTAEVVRASIRKQAIDVGALHNLVHPDRTDDLVVTILELERPGLRAAKARQALLAGHPTSIR